MYTNGKYILIGKKVVLETNSFKWAMWFETADRHVARSELADCVVSTVFLGLDHNFGCGDQPILFETIVFGGSHDGLTQRCVTYDEAEKMHQQVIADYLLPIQ